MPILRMLEALSCRDLSISLRVATALRNQSVRVCSHVDGMHPGGLAHLLLFLVMLHTRLRVIFRICRTEQTPLVSRIREFHSDSALSFASRLTII
jgi:hypothetical protein